jgi:DNA-binding NarL/FixJ family response regulator
MRVPRRVSVVILYTHPLLGLGLAKLLASEPDLEIAALQSVGIGAADEAIAAQEALAAGPDVVILERGPGYDATDLLKAVPNALVIVVGVDAGPTFQYQREEIPARPDGILRVIRHMKRANRAAVVGAFTLVATAMLPVGQTLGGG